MRLRLGIRQSVKTLYRRKESGAPKTLGQTGLELGMKEAYAEELTIQFSSV
jgi:hypothetical protein